MVLDGQACCENYKKMHIITLGNLCKCNGRCESKAICLRAEIISNRGGQIVHKCTVCDTSLVVEKGNRGIKTEGLDDGCKGGVMAGDGVGCERL